MRGVSLAWWNYLDQRPNLQRGSCEGQPTSRFASTVSHLPPSLLHYRLDLFCDTNQQGLRFILFQRTTFRTRPQQRAAEGRRGDSAEGRRQSGKVRWGEARVSQWEREFVQNRGPFSHPTDQNIGERVCGNPEPTFRGSSCFVRGCLSRSFTLPKSMTP